MVYSLLSHCVIKKMGHAEPGEKHSVFVGFLRSLNNEPYVVVGFFAFKLFLDKLSFSYATTYIS